jgi:hypothetical protein
MSNNYIAILQGTFVVIKDSNGSGVCTWNADISGTGKPTQALIRGDEVQVTYSDGKIGLFTIHGSGKRLF